LRHSALSSKSVSALLPLLLPSLPSSFFPGRRLFLPPLTSSQRLFFQHSHPRTTLLLRTPTPPTLFSWSFSSGSPRRWSGFPSTSNDGTSSLDVSIVPSGRSPTEGGTVESRKCRKYGRLFLPLFAPSTAISFLLPAAVYPSATSVSRRARPTSSTTDESSSSISSCKRVNTSTRKSTLPLTTISCELCEPSWPVWDARVQRRQRSTTAAKAVWEESALRCASERQRKGDFARSGRLLHLLSSLDTFRESWALLSMERQLGDAGTVESVDEQRRQLPPSLLARSPSRSPPCCALSPFLPPRFHPLERRNTPSQSHEIARGHSPNTLPLHFFARDDFSFFSRDLDHHLPSPSSAPSCAACRLQQQDRQRVETRESDPEVDKREGRRRCDGASSAQALR
jgi:hypothetical protein